ALAGAGAILAAVLLVLALRPRAGTDDDKKGVHPDGDPPKAMPKPTGPVTGYYARSVKGKEAVPLRFLDSRAVYENGREIGQWALEPDHIAVTFSDKRQGRVILNPEGEHRLTGKQVLADGSARAWELCKLNTDWQPLWNGTDLTGWKGDGW